ncbi:MAG: hypothetical protein IPP14_03150 [Planctomycetes bacterium]|nr:hypothetical protein [Planctomycetota bacterium]
MKVVPKRFHATALVHHIPVAGLTFPAPSGEVSDGQSWLQDISKAAATYAIDCAERIHTVVQQTALLDCFESAARVLDGQQPNAAPAHAPSKKFEAATLALLLASAHPKKFRFNPKLLGKIPKAVGKLHDACMIWQDLNEIRASFDALRRFFPDAAQQVQVDVLTNGCHVLGIDTTAVNDLLGQPAVPVHRRRSRFEIPLLGESLEGGFDSIVAALSKDFGASPWLFDLACDPRIRRALSLLPADGPLVVHSEAEWSDIFLNLRSHNDGLMPDSSTLSKVLQPQDIAALIDRMRDEFGRAASKVLKDAEIRRHYPDIPWHPWLIPLSDSSGVPNLALAVAAHRQLEGYYLVRALAQEDANDSDDQLKAVAKAFNKPWTEAFVRAQLLDSFGMSLPSGKGAQLTDDIFGAPDFEGDLAGVSVRKCPHPQDKNACGDLDIVLLDINRKEIRLIECKRFAPYTRWRDAGRALRSYWGESGSDRGGAFRQLQRKLEWLEYYRKDMVWPKGASLAKWEVVGGLLVNVIPQVLWTSGSHANAVAEFGSEDARAFLRGESSTFGATREQLRARPLGID